MIDFYQGIETETGQVLPYLQELSASLDPNQTANENYQKVEEQVQMLGNREALNLLRPDDALLSDALQKAKRYFLNEDKKLSYDLLLGIKFLEEEPDYLQYQEAGSSTQAQTAQETGRSFWLIALLSLASIWLLGLLFFFLHWNMIVLVFIISIIVILALLLDS